MTHGTSEGFRPALWVLVGLPALFSGWLVYHYGIDIPFWDEWTIAALLRRIDERSLTVAALFAQHNEHRVLVPLALQLLGALTMGWDTRFGMWVTQALLVAMLIGCIVLWRKGTLENRHSWVVGSFALVALILFSPAQSQNLFWGFQVCFYIPIACILASTIVASSATIAIGPTLAATSALCTIATFSIFPGLLTWPLAGAGVMLLRGRPRRDTALAWSGWATCCALVFGVFFMDYKSPTRSPSIGLALGDPLTLLGGVAASLGGSMGIGTQPVRSAMITGAAIGVVFVALLGTVWRRRADGALVRRATPWIVMGSFGLLTSAAIAVGRVGYGYIALLEPRYTAFAAWVLIGSVMIAATLRDALGTPATVRTWRAVAIAVLAMSATAFAHQLTSIRRLYHERLQSLAIYTFAESAPRGLPMVPVWVSWPPVRESLFHLEQHGWRAPRSQALAWVDNDEGQIRCSVGAVEFQVTPGPRTMAGGWAYFPKLGRPADAILVTITTGMSRRITAVEPPLIGRQDVAATFARDEALVTGWTVGAGNAGPNEIMDFWALDMKALRAYRLCHSAGT